MGLEICNLRQANASAKVVLSTLTTCKLASLVINHVKHAHLSLHVLRVIHPPMVEFLWPQIVFVKLVSSMILPMVSLSVSLANTLANIVCIKTAALPVINWHQDNTA